MWLALPALSSGLAFVDPSVHRTPHEPTFKLESEAPLEQTSRPTSITVSAPQRPLLLTSYGKTITINSGLLYEVGIKNKVEAREDSFQDHESSLKLKFMLCTVPSSREKPMEGGFE